MFPSRLLRHRILSKFHVAQISAVRGVLSENYSCEQLWQKRLENPLLKSINMDQYFIETDKKFGTKRLVSGIDIDLFANNVQSKSELDELEHLLYRFRRTKRATEMMESTTYAVIKAFLKFKQYDSLMRILNDRESYGVFPDLYSYNVLMSTFLQEKMYPGEQASADAEAAENYKLELAKIINEGGYSPDQIFSGDEAALYWKKLPSRTFISKNLRRAQGFKPSKEHITLHVCSNLSGSLMIKPIINRSSTPRVMKNINKTQLPVFWQSNKKSWMTQDLLKNWFYNCFIPAVETYTMEKNSYFKVLLVLDNAGCHNIELDHPNVKIVFLPPNCMSLIQLLDQGVIQTLKMYYIRQLFQTIFDRLENSENKTYSSVDGIFYFKLY
ncbi:tigger transposable element-derived protein 1 [Trichonephila inaurata madagascariensis]|uniref:Tigger transposable element-derived protein 1 n=1 Tax=Trichonephila inaurata madagascariensis TaxID=2747483 RepID=A0A8X6Y2M6_9ARAC|nr:tigger transposable element-derived protein 1 [Trichonephila inaurata madagascariensis]